ncbi:hypothetical protein [Williamsia sterculiae]|uniref:Uncharacterized protein n=1 Tax=Williamsia sterculiae TaxID=1344003 RepID=A0A1N7FKC8_9NOCA|nr:hypothetical protein [Williamsia sterculiae]SIS00809.1 hypothetical protein SAMN05445060_2146 [Williamsia sterculiae]
MNPPSGVPAVVRWTTSHATTPAPEIRRLAASLWPEASDTFLDDAASLLQALDEDRKVIPRTPSDPRCALLAQVISHGESLRPGRVVHEAPRLPRLA